MRKPGLTSVDAVDPICPRPKPTSEAATFRKVLHAAEARFELTVRAPLLNSACQHQACRKSIFCCSVRNFRYSWSRRIRGDLLNRVGIRSSITTDQRIVEKQTGVVRCILLVSGERPVRTRNINIRICPDLAVNAGVKGKERSLTVEIN